MNDHQKLENITEAFTKALIANNMDDREKYKELAHRLAELLDKHLAWKFTDEENRLLMRAWGSLNN